MTDKTKVVYQHGTLAMLVPGFLKGTTDIDHLLSHGDSGIGTAEGLDGEMIILNGTPYLIRGDGSVTLINSKAPLLFATVHFDNPDSSFEVENVSMKQLGMKILEKYPYKNIFFAIKIEGIFEKMETRAVLKQKRPYPSLLEVANQQRTFVAKNTKGAVIGYYAPEIFHGMAVSGYHLHYINDEHTMGGHILDFKIKQAKVSVQAFETIEQHLPIYDEEFLNHDPKASEVSSQITKAEGK